MGAHRRARLVDDSHQVTIDLDFDTVEDATAFRGPLEQIWRTSQSQGQLRSHGVARVYDVVEQRTL
jgi:hypothetical protein